MDWPVMVAVAAIVLLFVVGVLAIIALPVVIIYELLEILNHEQRKQSISKGR
jgi:hypothetical protein